MARRGGGVKEGRDGHFRSSRIDHRAPRRACGPGAYTYVALVGVARTGRRLCRDKNKECACTHARTHTHTCLDCRLPARRLPRASCVCGWGGGGKGYERGVGVGASSGAGEWERGHALHNIEGGGVASHACPSRAPPRGTAALCWVLVGFIRVHAEGRGEERRGKTKSHEKLQRRRGRHEGEEVVASTNTDANTHVLTHTHTHTNLH